MEVLLVSNSGIFHLLYLSQRLRNKNWAWEIGIQVLSEMLRIGGVSKGTAVGSLVYCYTICLLLLYLYSQTLNPSKMKEEKIDL